jgi:hypothetical protein
VALLYPVVMAAAAALAWRSRARPGGRGPAWLAGWTIAGFLVGFSFVTGLSIGLFILPIAALVLLTVARLSPHFPEAAGFFVGIAAVAILIVAISAV